MINIKCPKCDLILEADKECVGEQVECPECGSEFIVNNETKKPSLVSVKSAVNSDLDMDEFEDPIPILKQEETKGDETLRCPQCDGALKEGQVVCINCGFDKRFSSKLQIKKNDNVPPPFEPIYDSSIETKNEVLANLSLGLGIFSVLCGGPFIGIPAIIVGVLALSKINKGLAVGKKKCVFGISFGSLSIVLLIIFFPIISKMEKEKKDGKTASASFKSSWLGSVLSGRGSDYSKLYKLMCEKTSVNDIIKISGNNSLLVRKREEMLRYNDKIDIGAVTLKREIIKNYLVAEKGASLLRDDPAGSKVLLKEFCDNYGPKLEAKIFNESDSNVEALAESMARNNDVKNVVISIVLAEMFLYKTQKHSSKPKVAEMIEDFSFATKDKANPVLSLAEECARNDLNRNSIQMYLEEMHSMFDK